MVVIHYTAMTDREAEIRALSDPGREVSAHYLIDRWGGVVRLVDEARRAWHAGRAHWAGARDVNSRAIGIELSNDGASPFPAAQMDALEALLGEILARHGIRPERVLAHSDVSPGRKIDPGRRFDWARLARAGLAVRAEAQGGGAVSETGFRRDLAAAGYDPDCRADTLLAAFRLRHRPGAEGPLDATDCALAADLARRWPSGAGDDAAIDRSAPRA